MLDLTMLEYYRWFLYMIISDGNTYTRYTTLCNNSHSPLQRSQMTKDAD